MSSPEDVTANQVERRVSEYQRQEREELAAQLERDRAADERIVDALSDPGGTPGR